MWWASYSAVQEALWRSLYYAGADVGDEDWGAIVAVQAASAFVGGCISGGVTTPLDVVKTQLQARLSLLDPIHSLLLPWDRFCLPLVSLVENTNLTCKQTAFCQIYECHSTADCVLSDL